MQRSWPELPGAIRGFVVLCVVLELVSLAGSLVLPGDGMRRLLLGLGGFWPQLLAGGQPVYPGQPLLMFATTTVLHGGLLHLFMNMVAFMWLGPIVIDRVGEKAFWPIVGLSALGSGFVFAFLSTSAVPMVGASGILFGLIGVVAMWDLLDRLAHRAPLRPLIEQAVAFVVLNVALMLVAGGNIAWQAHLGGCLAGILCGAISWNALSRRRG